MPVDLPIAADAALALPALLAAVEDRLRHDARGGGAPGPGRAHRRAPCRAPRGVGATAVRIERSSKPLAPSALAAEIWEVIKDEDWMLANGTGKGWARRLWDWQPERSYGGSGGAGLGYGLPAALGVALAHRGSGKLCVNLQADGDLLYVVSGLYTAAHHRLPLLTVMFNNRTYGNDEAHQDAVAKTRGRPVENKVVGIRIDDPAPDFARIAQGFGVHAEGPIDTAEAVGPGAPTRAPRRQGRGSARAGRRDHAAVMRDAWRCMARERLSHLRRRHAHHRAGRADRGASRGGRPREARGARAPGRARSGQGRHVALPDRQAAGPRTAASAPGSGSSRRPRQTRGARDGGTPWDVRWQGPPFPSDRVSFDPHARVKDMDIEGVDVNMILPSGGVPAFCALDDVALEQAMYQAYHRFLARLLRPLPGSLDEPHPRLGPRRRGLGGRDPPLRQGDLARRHLPDLPARDVAR